MSLVAADVLWPATASVVHDRMSGVAKYETELVEQLRRGLPLWLTSVGSRWSVQPEFAVGQSIADLVIFLHGSTRRAVAEPLTVQESVVLASLRVHGPTRIDILERRCGLDRTRLRLGALQRLSDWGLLKDGPGGRVSVGRTIAGRCRVYAIEAKLKRWRAALRQPSHYTRYADRAYVALPEATVSRNSIDLDQFKTAGVGLMRVSDQSVREVVPAVERGWHDWRREFVVSRLACSLQGDGST